MWDLIVSVPDHCLSFYSAPIRLKKVVIRQIICRLTNLSIFECADLYLISTRHYRILILMKIVCIRVNFSSVKTKVLLDTAMIEIVYDTVVMKKQISCNGGHVLGKSCYLGFSLALFYFRCASAFGLKSRKP